MLKNNLYHLNQKKKNTWKKILFLLSISNSSGYMISFINQKKKVNWKNGVILFVEKEDTILFENKDRIDHSYL